MTNIPTDAEYLERLKKPITDEKLAELDSWYSKCSSNSLKFCDADYLAIRARLALSESERDAAEKTEQMPCPTCGVEKYLVGVKKYRVIDGQLCEVVPGVPPELVGGLIAERDAARANADKACEENTRLRGALAPFAVLGCSDGNCVFRDSRGGQHTNGGCGCLGRSQLTRREKLGELIEGARVALSGT